MIFRIAFLTAMAVLPAAAQEAKTSAANRLYDEQARCIAYYTFVRGCSLEAQEINVATQATRTIDYLRKQAAQTAQRLKLESEAVLARQKAALDELNRSAANSCNRMPALEEAHAARCRRVVEKPEAILDELQGKP